MSNEQCVPFYLCSDHGLINVDGDHLIDEQRDEAETNEPCPLLEVCCKFGNVLPNQVPKSEASACTIEGNVAMQTPIKCGFRNKNGLEEFGVTENKIDFQAGFGEFPWMVAVLKEVLTHGLKAKKIYGGGSLIHPKVVLTTAHKAVETNELLVRAGEWNTQSENEPQKHEEKKVQSIIVHEHFNRKNLQNDLALLILTDAFELSAFISTICLPQKGSNFDNQRCFASGWGKNKFGKSGVYQHVLKKLELPVIPSSICQKHLSKTRLEVGFILHDGFLCAGNFQTHYYKSLKFFSHLLKSTGGEKGVGLCSGDGGSPLVCSISSNPEYYFQAGVAVGGMGCGIENVPSLLVDVSKYREWIDLKLCGIGIGSSSYTFNQN